MRTFVLLLIVGLLLFGLPLIFAAEPLFVAPSAGSFDAVAARASLVVSCVASQTASRAPPVAFEA